MSDQFSPWTKIDAPDPYSQPVPQMQRLKESMKFDGEAPDFSTFLQQMVTGQGLPWWKRGFNQMIDMFVPENPLEMMPAAGTIKKLPKVVDLRSFRETGRIFDGSGQSQTVESIRERIQDVDKKLTDKLAERQPGELRSDKVYNEIRALETEKVDLYRALDRAHLARKKAFEKLPPRKPVDYEDLPDLIKEVLEEIDDKK